MAATASERIAKANQIFLSAILKGKIEAIAQAAYEIFGHPVVILDNAGRVICQVPNKPIGYWLWDEWVSQKRSPLESNLEAIKNYNEHVEPGKNAFYSVINREIGVGTGIILRYYENTICAGHCGIMVGDYVPDETDMEIAEMLSDILTYFYSNSSAGSSPNIYRNVFLAKILAGEATNDDLVLMDYNLNATLKKEFIVLVSEIPEIYKANDMGYFICDNVARRFQNAVPIVFHDCLVILCCQLSKNDCENPYQSEKITAILNYLFEYNMVTGISTGFSDIRDLKAFYEQAYMTLMTGLKLEPQKLSFAFGDYVPYQMLTMASQPKILMHPLVGKIRNYDREHYTEYLKTYKSYILAGKDKKYVASELNIHLNTLKYRLNMINDHFHIEDFSKQEELHIILSLLLDNLETGSDEEK